MGRPDGTGGNGRAGDGLSKKGERGRKKGGGGRKNRGATLGLRRASQVQLLQLVSFSFFVIWLDFHF